MMSHIPKMTPFYEKVKSIFSSTQQKQILKGAEKYDEPFNPDSWTATELLDHGMQEAVDLMTYLTGLHEKVQALEEENKRLRHMYQRIKVHLPDPIERELLRQAKEAVSKSR